MQKIKLVIPLKGNPTLTTEGFSGPACKEATRDLERALGKVVKDTPTTEMYDKPINEQINQY